MIELISTLKDSKDMRDTLKLLIDMLDNMERMQNELDVYDDNIEDVRHIARKLEAENNRLLQDKKSLEMDKRALTQFIVDEIQDEKKLGKIFNF